MRDLPDEQNAEQRHAGGASDPVTAVHPIIGGTAPGTAPMIVFSVVRRFIGV